MRLWPGDEGRVDEESRKRYMLSIGLLASGESSQTEETINGNSTGQARTHRTPPREGRASKGWWKEGEAKWGVLGWRGLTSFMPFASTMKSKKLTRLAACPGLSSRTPSTRNPNESPADAALPIVCELAVRRVSSLRFKTLRNRLGGCGSVVEGQTGRRMVRG